MKMTACCFTGLLGVHLAARCCAGIQDYGQVELLRDTWGVPHIFSDTDRGALYGLGCATAQERGFQMTYGLRIMQGRLAEVIGDRQKAGRRETALENDRRMRTFGWARAAARIASNLDAETKGLLEAYCEGVNASFDAQQKAGTLHPLFRKLGVTPERWTPADCLLSWWHVAQFFAGDGTRDLMVWHNRLHPQPGLPPPPQPGASWADDGAAVVQRQDVSASWLREVLDGQTIHCQSAQSYTQWVPLDDVDSAQTICPVGHSDRPDSPYRTSTFALWGGAKLHPAPLSRKAVERITAERTKLVPQP